MPRKRPPTPVSSSVIPHEPEPYRVQAELFGPIADRLLERREVAAMLGMHPNNVSRYARRFPVLTGGMRVVRSKEKSSHGTGKWLHSAVLEHIRVELLKGRSAEFDVEEQSSPPARLRSVS